MKSKENAFRELKCRSRLFASFSLFSWHATKVEGWCDFSIFCLRGLRTFLDVLVVMDISEEIVDIAFVWNIIK